MFWGGGVCVGLRCTPAPHGPRTLLHGADSAAMLQPFFLPRDPCTLSRSFIQGLASLPGSRPRLHGWGCSREPVRQSPPWEPAFWVGWGSQEAGVRLGMVNAWAHREQVGEGSTFHRGPRKTHLFSSDLQRKGSSCAVVWAAETQQREETQEEGPAGAESEAGRAPGVLGRRGTGARQDGVQGKGRQEA